MARRRAVRSGGWARRDRRDRSWRRGPLERSPAAAEARGMSRVAVVGAGTMGHGIAQVFAQHGWDTALIDVSADALARAVKAIDASLQRLVKKGAISSQQSGEALARIKTSTNLDHLENTDL